jgi:steroid delta-isomerase-like uncharacterized protein
MSEANKLLLKRWYEQVWNQKKESAIDEMFHEGTQSHGFPEQDSVLEGPEAFKTIHRRFCGAFPDLRVDLEQIVAEGDNVAVRWRVNATHTGDHLGFPGTGKKVILTGSTFAIVQNNKIVQGWNHMDLQGMMQKLQA